MKNKAIVKAIVIDSETNKQSSLAVVEFDVAKTKWKMAGQFKDLERAELIFDGDENTAWTLRNEPPMDFVIDLGENLTIGGFKYLPDQGRWNPGVIFAYELYVSKNGKSWGEPVSLGEFSNIRNSPIWQKKEFQATTGRFVRLRALTSALESGKVGIAEFDIITR